MCNVCIIESVQNRMQGRPDFFRPARFDLQLAVMDIREKED
jgi:hypothetical protein